MSDLAMAAPIPVYASTLTAGVVLGGLFFGSLWWTTRRGLASARPVLWFGGGLLVRAALALSGFWLCSGGDWRRLLVCLAGFVVARLVVTQLVARVPADSSPAPGRSGHAP